ncbi:uncharacterized protein LOC119371562 [Jatropha curcas]|uniref:uncharacterized protein LOC119371562 n=1 Tax=Jatropha curcas TaxID=180498 RepID=UPI0018952D27|nr:uncharacterized protein LOC119371562 [Jatropha curcas]
MEMHAKARVHMSIKNKNYANRANKRKRHDVFKPGDWVWVHFRKEKFPSQRKIKFDKHGDRALQVLEHIDDNTYKIDLPGKYDVSIAFNISNLSPFDINADLRMNLFEEKGNDTNPPLLIHGTQGGKENNMKNPLVLPSGSITRNHAKKYGEVHCQRNME